MTPPSLWKTIPFVFTCMEALSFYCFVPRKPMEHLPTFLRAAKSRIFFSSVFFLSLPPRRCFFLRRARQCQVRLGSSWMPRASGGEGKKSEVGEILLISSCRFPFLYLTVALLFYLTHSIATHFFFKLSIRGWETFKGQGQERKRVNEIWTIA